MLLLTYSWGLWRERPRDLETKVTTARTRATSQIKLFLLLVAVQSGPVSVGWPVSVLDRVLSEIQKLNFE